MSKVCFAGNCFNIEKAKTYFEKTKGLMFRKNLDQNKGMLFVFDKEDIYSFWMKNTLIPLDIIWIDGNNKIVFISEDNRPCEVFFCPIIKSAQKARYILELNAGASKKIGLKIGDAASIEF